MTKPVIGVFIGSLRKESWSRKIARNLENLASGRLEFSEVDLSLLQMYNQDLDDEGRAPASWIEFRKQVKTFDGFLFVTPEYNRSVPPLLKNALDIGSRPYGQSVWNGKPGAVIGVSPGAMGGFGACQNLRQSLVVLDIPTMQQPEAYIGNVASLLDEQGKVKEEKTKAFLQKIMEAYGNWVHLLLSEKQ
jgi:chromate reductase, NAD(P)H dehydrogenase (quinone)